MRLNGLEAWSPIFLLGNAHFDGVLLPERACEQHEELHEEPYVYYAQSEI